jgi:hypothetical protein
MRRFTCALLALVALQTTPAARALALAAAPFPVVPIENPKPRRHTWAYLSMAAGAGLVGLSFVYSRRADDAYNAYLESSDVTEIETLFDRAVHNDHVSQASLLTGEALIATGLYLRFIRRPAPRRVSLTVMPSRCAVSFRF